MTVTVTERSTGWIVHWGEKMAETDASSLVAHTSQLLAYGNNTGSVSLYVAHGGTNFGFFAGLWPHLQNSFSHTWVLPSLRSAAPTLLPM